MKRKMETEKIDVPKVLNEARELYKKFEFIAAERLFKEVLKSPCCSDEEKVKSQFNLGKVLFMQGKFSEAESCYKEAISLAKDNKMKNKCRVKLADVLFMLEKFTEAKGHYETDVCLHQDDNTKMEWKMKIEKKDVPEVLEKARGFYKKSEFSEAEQSFKKVLKSPHCSEGENMNVQLELGEVLFMQGNFTEAGICYRDIISSAQDNKMMSIGYVKLADVLFMLKRYFEAEMYYKKAIGLDQDENAMCMCYIRLEKAVDLFLNISLKGICRIKLGDALYMGRKFAEAENIYKELVDYFQDINMKGTCYLKLGDALLMQKDYGCAENYYNKAGDTFLDEDKKAICQLKLGDSSFMQEKFPDAERCYEEAIKLKGSVDLARQCYIRLGSSLCQMGRFIEAKDILKKAAKSYPTYHKSQIIYPITQQEAVGAPIIIRPTKSLHCMPENPNHAKGEIDEDDALIYSNLAEVMYYLGNKKEEKHYRHIVDNINQTLKTIVDAREKKIPFGHIIKRYVKPCKEEVKKAYENKNVYPMTLDKRGLCIIINNIIFFKTPEKPEEKREGSEIDQENMANVFRQLQFDVRIKNNLKCEEMIEEVTSWVHNDKNDDCNAFVLVIMSHGSPHQIYGSDREAVDRGKILEIVYNAKKLAGKPRLTIIQACRGVNWIDGNECETGKIVSTEEKYPPSKVASKNNNPVKNADADPDEENIAGIGLNLHGCLTMSATKEGLSAPRIPGKGSPFIASLTENLFKYSHRKHIGEVFEDVKNSLDNQVPNLDDFTRGKSLYFVPGNYILKP